MITKLVRHGDDLAIIIDKSIIELLNITEATEFDIKTDGVDIILRPVNASKPVTRIISDNPKLQKIYEDLLEQYDDLLRKLSKN